MTQTTETPHETGMLRILSHDLRAKATRLEHLLEEDASRRGVEAMEITETLEYLDQTLRHLSDRFRTSLPY